MSVSVSVSASKSVSVSVSVSVCILASVSGVCVCVCVCVPMRHDHSVCMYAMEKRVQIERRAIRKSLYLHKYIHDVCRFGVAGEAVVRRALALQDRQLDPKVHPPTPTPTPTHPHTHPHAHTLFFKRHRCSEAAL